MFNRLHFRELNFDDGLVAFVVAVWILLLAVVATH